jgi:ABC-type glycerol-3-phosphate transport system substrate-binding protein
MKHNVLKQLAVLMALVLAVGLTACGGSDTGPANTPAPPAAAPPPADPGTSAPVTQPEEISVPLRDLGGIEIIVSDWWTNNDAVQEPPTNLREEELRDYRDKIFADYNFTLKRKSISGWGAYMETFTTSVMAQDPAADIFIMSDGWGMQLLMQGLLYPLNTLDSLDLKNPKWNSIVSGIFTAGGSTYAITNEKFIEPRNFLFFNKRLFADAGIDPNEPYDLQARGEWTWDKFLDYCARLTRDLDNDGINDVYGFVGFEVEVASGFVFSNNARYISKNANGTFYNSMSEPNFLEAMQFAKGINERGYWCPSPEGAEWDWFITGFHDGHAAMIIREAYSTGTWADMDDDWGMLMPPKGPKASDYNTYFSENVYCLPFNISKEKAEDLMFGFNLYTEQLPYDVQNPDYWKDGGWGYQRFRDTRSVDDTLDMFYGGLYEANNRNYVPGIDWGPTYDWGSIMGAETVNEKVEAAKPVVDAAIDETNAKLQ